ncbi:MAG TPA: hypothetical protein VGB00_19985 [Pyrinomonadaceae bacterium]
MFGALVLTGESDDLKVCSALESAIVLDSASSFDSSKIFKAAFAFLLNLFFSFAIIYSFLCFEACYFYKLTGAAG